MGWLRDASRGLPQEQQAARAPEARCCRVLRSPCAAVVPTTSAEAEVISGSTSDAYFGRALCVVGTCARAVCAMSGS